MAAISYPLINGVRHDWNSIVTDLGAGVELGLTAINYKWTQDRAEVYGASPQPLGHTLGQYKPEASIEMLFHEYNEMIKRLGKGFALRRFMITVSYEPPGLPIVQDRIYGACITGADHSNARGNEATVVKIDLKPLFILENGVAPIPKPLGIT